MLCSNLWVFVEVVHSSTSIIAELKLLKILVWLICSFVCSNSTPSYFTIMALPNAAILDAVLVYQYLVLICILC